MRTILCRATYKKIALFCVLFIFTTAGYAERNIITSFYEIRALNDEKRIGFNHVYKHTVEDNIEDKSLSDAESVTGLITVYLPKEKGKYPLILITHGWKNSKFSFLALGRTIASSGYAVAVFTSKKKSLPKDWLAAFSSVYKLLKEKTQEKSHILYGYIDTENVGVAGHSMGGAAALYFANFMPFVKAVTAIHPYNGASKAIELVGSKNEELGDEFSGIKGAVLILTSEADLTAYPEKSYRFFKNLNEKIPACFLSFQNIKHNSCLDAYRSLLSGGYNKDVFQLYADLITAWFHSFLQDKKDNLDFFKKDGNQFAEIKDMLYTHTNRKHEKYPNYDSKNLAGN